MNKAAIWLRVSSDDQNNDNQRPALESLAERRGFQVAAVYEAVASGWQGAHQKQLNQLFEDAGRGRFEYLLIWSLDRLSREGPEAILGIVNRLGRAGVTIISLQEPWVEVSGEFRDLLLSVAGWVARWESQRRSERTKAGLQRALREGKRLGRKVVVDTVDVDLVTQLREEGQSWSEIHQAHPRTVKTPHGGYKRPSVGTIRRAMACNKGDGSYSNNGHLAG